MLFLPLNNGEVYPIDGDTIKILFKFLLDKTKLLGHKMSFNEALSDPEMIAPNQYAFYFESFEMAAQMVWEEIEAQADNRTDDEDAAFVNYDKDRAGEIKREKQREKEQSLALARQNRQDYLETESELKAKMARKGGRLPSHSKAAAKDALEQFYQQYGRMPTTSECNSVEKNLPSYQVLHRYFGTKEDWLQMVRGHKTTREPEKDSVVKEYPIKPGEPFDIHLETPKFRFTITSTDKTVYVKYTEK